MNVPLMTQSEAIFAHATTESQLQDTHPLRFSLLRLRANSSVKTLRKKEIP